MPLVFGYARVSTEGQTLEAQLARVEAAGTGGSAGKVCRKKAITPTSLIDIFAAVSC